MFRIGKNKDVKVKYIVTVPQEKTCP